jgi:hypothetical protein
MKNAITDQKSNTQASSTASEAGSLARHDRSIETREGVLTA